MQLLTMPQRARRSPVFQATVPVQQNAARPQPRLAQAQASLPHARHSMGSTATDRPAPRPLPAVVPLDAESALPRDIASRFGRRVRELRHARAMTQVEVAVHFGIDRTFISDVERGRKSVCLPTMEVFALGFGLSLSDLLRGL